MKLNCRKLVLVCLMLVMICTLCACSGGQDKKDKEMMIGTWVSDPLNFASVMNKSFEEEPSMAELVDYMKLNEFNLKLYIDIREDGTYTLKFEDGSVDTAFDGAMEEWKAGMRRYFEDAIKAQGLDMDVDSMLAASGMDLDSMMDEVKVQAKNEMVNAAKQDGYYEVKGGKFFMAESKDQVAKSGSYEAFTITADTFTLIDDGAPVGGVNASMSDMLKELYPVVLHKQ